ncbi:MULTISPECIES: FHA domain-containing protein [Rhodococcus]|uniref:FHA domain-containing protein n=1 Tax=Rhodococcus pseudokoreensis TaxID=2811421 RepID=A0A974VX60_9NOCA|nr:MULTISPECIES: FHA domain-containing protein [Rhodococcus]KAF0957406.1 hypothetical protein MLGJGCBP_09238 [Rhodococcus sp. T7]KAF0962123.1 hypothetical protein MLGJGCBP_04744 [Rhodococcus sp. T7]QSE87358.1 FHA domain-containing protein [Rhodococcus pseudokoreensis]
MNALSEPTLCYLDGGYGTREFVLSVDAPRITVGRSEKADIALPSDPNVSRLHATIEWIGSYWTVTDDGLSRNGTFVNGDRLSGRRRLHAGDVIRIGSSSLTFRTFIAASGEMTGTADALPTRAALTPAQFAVLVELCRPYKNDAAYAHPASNQEIADHLFLTVDTIKCHLRVLFSKFGLEDLPNNQKRMQLVARARHSGIITTSDL